MYPQPQIETNSQLQYLQTSSDSKTAVILFHGYGASMMDLYGLADMVDTKESIDWIFPNGHIELHPTMMARAWFPLDEKALDEAMRSGTHRDFSELNHPEFQDAVEKCSKFISAMSEKYDKLIVGGFSQGSMISTHAALRNSHKVSALICLSGALIAKESILEAFDIKDANNFPFFQSHGKDDAILSYSYAKQLFGLLKLGGHEGEFISFDGGHEIPMIVLTKLNKFLNRI